MTVAEQTGVILTAFTIATAIVPVTIRYFIRAVMQEELDKLRGYVDKTFTEHLKHAHGSNELILRKRPRLNYRGDDETDVNG